MAIRKPWRCTILVLLTQLKQVLRKPNAFFLAFALVGKKANADFAINDVKGVDHIDEAELGRCVEKFLLFDLARIELPASGEESA